MAWTWTQVGARPWVEVPHVQVRSVGGTLPTGDHESPASNRSLTCLVAMIHSFILPLFMLRTLRLPQTLLRRLHITPLSPRTRPRTVFDCRLFHPFAALIVAITTRVPLCLLYSYETIAPAVLPADPTGELASMGLAIVSGAQAPMETARPTLGRLCYPPSPQTRPFPPPTHRSRRMPFLRRMPRVTVPLATPPRRRLSLRHSILLALLTEVLIRILTTFIHVISPQTTRMPPTTIGRRCALVSHYPCAGRLVGIRP